jgi:hypothetical protein
LASAGYQTLSRTQFRPDLRQPLEAVERAERSSEDDRKIRARVRQRVERILARSSPALVERLDALLSVYERNGERGGQ